MRLISDASIAVTTLMLLFLGNLCMFYGLWELLNSLQYAPHLSLGIGVWMILCSVGGLLAFELTWGEAEATWHKNMIIAVYVVAIGICWLAGQTGDPWLAFGSLPLLIILPRIVHHMCARLIRRQHS